MGNAKGTPRTKGIWDELELFGKDEQENVE